MITLQDIARTAGVSSTTVSRALAGSPLVNEETRRRIKRIAEEAGYEVNHVARSLAMRSTMSLGLVVPEVQNPYYPRLIQLVADHARAAGYSLQLHLSGSEQQDEAACLRTLRMRRADGVILVTTDRALVAWDEVRKIRRQDVPLVLLGWVEGAADLDLIAGDDFTGAYDLTRHLLSLGHQRIVLIGPKEYRGSHDRVHGFLHALEQAGLPTDRSLRLGVHTDHDVRASLDDLLGQPRRPTAVFAYHDALAASVLRYLGEVGVCVPQQMAVVGFDNLDLATYVSPPLTTVDHQMEPLVEEAVATLLRRIETGPGALPPRQVILPPRLIVRRSCGADPPLSGWQASSLPVTVGHGQRERSAS